MIQGYCTDLGGGLIHVLHPPMIEAPGIGAPHFLGARSPRRRRGRRGRAAGRRAPLLLGVPAAWLRGCGVPALCTALRCVLGNVLIYAPLVILYAVLLTLSMFFSPLFHFSSLVFPFSLSLLSPHDRGWTLRGIGKCRGSSCDSHGDS